MSHASSIDFNIESQYNVKWSFLVLLQRLVIPGSGIFQIHIPIWIFLDCVIVKLLWFASIYFNIIVAPVSTTVITGCYFWLITFFRPFPLPPSPIYWYLRYLSDSSFLLRPFPFIWNWRVKDLISQIFSLKAQKLDTITDICYWQ